MSLWDPEQMQIRLFKKFKLMKKPIKIFQCRRMNQVDSRPRRHLSWKKKLSKRVKACLHTERLNSKYLSRSHLIRAIRVLKKSLILCMWTQGPQAGLPHRSFLLVVRVAALRSLTSTSLTRIARLRISSSKCLSIWTEKKTVLGLKSSKNWQRQVNITLKVLLWKT